MKVRNAKRLITILICIMLTLLFSVSIVNIVSKLNLSSIDNSVCAASSDLKDYTSLDDATYNSIDSFFIRNKQGLLNLHKIMIADSRTFAGKYIFLMTDIDLSGEDWVPIGLRSSGYVPFSGCFEADGHTISNITCKESIVNNPFSGLFASVNGQKWTENNNFGSTTGYDVYPGVFNLRIKNMRIIRDFYRYHHIGGGLTRYIGGDAKILKCEVDGLTVKVENKDESNFQFSFGTFIGGIAGVCDSTDVNGNGIVPNCLIEDCYVQNFNINITTYDDAGKGYDTKKYSADLSVAGIGPAAMYYNQGVCTVKNSVFKKSSSTWTINDSQLSVEKCDIAKNGTVAGSWSVKLENTYCLKGSSSKDFSGLSISSNNNNTWFFDSTYNDGFPKLTKWIGKTVNYEFYYIEGNSNAEFGYVKEIDTLNAMTEDEIKGRLYSWQPNILSVTYSQTEPIIKIGDKQIEAKPIDSSYIFKEWEHEEGSYKYTATFKRACKKLTFNNATGTLSGETIAPVVTTETGTIKAAAVTNTFTLDINTSISVNSSAATGLQYAFTDANETQYYVTYKISEKYSLVGTYNSFTITGDTTITPEVKIKTYTVTFKSADNSDKTSDSSLTVNHGYKVSYSIDSNKKYIKFTQGINTIIYNAKDNCTYDSCTNLASLTSVTSNITIQPKFIQWYTVTFSVKENTTQPTSVKTINVKSGESVTATGSGGKTLTYSYNSESVVYKASQFYILYGKSTTINSNTTITPTVSFYACEVTMGAINSSYGTRPVSGDSYGTENDGVFAVNFGTTVGFKTELSSSNVFTYTYTFSSGQTVKYTMKSAYYAMQYTISSGSRTKILNDISGDSSYTFGTGVTSKTISPTFGKRQMIVGLNSAANTQTTSNTYWEVNYGDTIGFSNSNNTNLTYTYGGHSLTYQPNAGFKCFNISYVGKTWSGSEVTLAETDLASVVYDITITPEYTRVYNVKFNTCENATLSASTNPIEVKYGESVTVDKTSTNKLIYKYNGNTVATYTAYQYYIWNTSPELLNVTGEQLEYTIQPTFEFNACMVTFGFIGTDDITTYGNLSALLTNGSGEIKNNGNGKVGEITVTGDNYGTTNDGIFVVEFGTILTFTSDIDTYTYTFSLNGIETHKITYKITNDDYAMQYEINISTGERTKILNGLNGSDSYEFKKANGKSKTITPEFGQRQYMVEME